jgi:uncharacterized phage protein gp47/JayE
MFSLPTLNDLMTRARLSFRANLKGSDAWVWPNNVYASAKVIGGMTFEAFGFIAYVSKQMFAHTAPDLDSLLLHGAEFAITQKPAAPGGGNVIITAADAITVAAGAVLQRSDNVQYIAARGGGLTTAGTLTIPVEAATDGAVTNCAPGTQLAIISGLTDINGDANATAAVDGGGIVQGADVEDIESYRARILFRKRNPPHGGSAADYVMWGTQASGVTRVFVERLWNGPGTVRVFFLMDSTYADGIPQTADVDRVAAYINGLQPAGAEVSVVAPIAHPINLTIHGLSPNTTGVQEAILAELRDTFLRRSVVAGNDSANAGLPFLAVPSTFSLQWLWQAIANATGEDRSVLVSPAADIALATTEIATLGTVTFT